MASVIKASGRGAGVCPVAFNFTDMAGEANERLGQFRDEAEAILEAACRDAEKIRREAARDGVADAEEKVRREITAENAQRMAALLPAMQQAIEDIRHAKQAWLAHWEKSAVGVAAAIAQRLVRRELAASPEITLTLVREALELAVGGDQVRLHLNPDDLQTLGSQLETLTKELSHLAASEVIANPTISRGGCRVETRFGVIDQQFEAQLKRIEEELT